MQSPPYGQPAQQPYAHQPRYGQAPGYGQNPYAAPPANPYAAAAGEVVTIPGAGSFKLAGMGDRFVARLIDGLIVGIPMVIISLIIVGAMTPSTAEILRGETGPGFLVTGLVYFGALLVISVAYEVGMISTQGATFGKKAMGVRVATAETAATPGRGIGQGPAVTRWAVMFAPAIVPFVGGLWLLVCYLSPFFDDVARQGFHDKAAKTWVLSTK
ncbi:MAG TPA: RDD family protein [Actinophytocola sp.]|uniref:RDD family protein n=1 Tax=Actinophytocola sp. TaxID=1872138 RepID=UPI002DDDA137|nr:RDD family protein [Actinophytocola sp.]HEV2783003.1 RDD family protein [Actinophytocola sp.]